MNDNLWDYRRIETEYRKWIPFIRALFTNIVNVDKHVAEWECGHWSEETRTSRINTLFHYSSVFPVNRLKIIQRSIVTVDAGDYNNATVR
jgi:hypothetical protein